MKGTIQANFFKGGIPVACWGSVYTTLTHPKFICIFSLLLYIWANLLVESFSKEVGKYLVLYYIWIVVQFILP